MSVVISAKYKDGIAIIADKQVTCGTTKSNNGNKLQYFKYSNSAIGVVGYLRDCNIIRTIEEILPYKDILDKVLINDLYVIRTIIPVIYHSLQQNKRITVTNGTESMDSVMLYCTKDKMFEIGQDFSVLEIDDYYYAIGCGGDKASGFLSSVGDTSNLTKEEITKILQEAVKKGCEKDVYINDYTDIIFLEYNK